MERNPEAIHEWRSPRAIAEALLIAKVAIFDEMIDYHLDGMITFEEAIDQYNQDVELLDI